MAQHWFKILIALFLVFACVFTAYYFLSFLPQKERAAQELKRQEALATKQAAQKEVYRKECQQRKDNNLNEYQRFIKVCGSRNTVEWCNASEAGQLFSDTLSADFVSSCIQSMEEEYMQNQI